jgi:Protein of unknown function (DUF4058)
MPYPFPGMNPYLEGYLWPDVHNALANKIRQILVPLLRPRYTARLEIYLVEDTAPNTEIGILYPDVEILQTGQTQSTTLLFNNSTATATTPAALKLPVLQPVEVRIPTIEIRDTAKNVLVTSIEILSPVNKREPGLTLYRQKCQRLYKANVHLIEIDLLRRGTRRFSHPRLPNVPYLITLTRAQSALVEIWPISLQDCLPTIPVPLRQPDADIGLDLTMALKSIYDEAAYELSIDYSQNPPPPACSEAEMDWMRSLIAQENLG